MSVLIKGMEMPKNCSECRLLEGDSWDGLCHGARKWLDDDDFFSWYQYPEGDIDASKPVNCPLIEVPTPHGRLVDADKLEVHDGWLSEAEGYSTHITFVYSNAIDLAPTVIEAEVEQ